MRTNFLDTPEPDLRQRAACIATSLVRAIADREKQLLSAEFSYTKRVKQSDAAGRSETGLHFEERLPEMRDEVSWTKVSHVKLGAVLVERSEDTDLDGIIQLSERTRRSPSLQRMVDWKSEFYADSEKKLGPLYNIFKLAETEFGGPAKAASTLGISRNALDDASGITNNPNIRTSRHPGEAAGELREITYDELTRCQQIAEKIIRAYAARIPL